MGYLEAIILGIVQGLTEFLPVSSSGHLELGKVLLGDTSLPKESMLFTVVVHFATALSTLVIFRRQVFGVIAGLFEAREQRELVVLRENNFKHDSCSDGWRLIR